MDNATFHRKKILIELAMKTKCNVLFLPPYSPDYNPIEKKWANMKKYVRNYAYKHENLQNARNKHFKVEEVYLFLLLCLVLARNRNYLQ